MEEERRLAYVAITRAMKNLNISCAKARMIRGETQYNRPSRFIKEIPAELLDGGMASKKIDSGAHKTTAGAGNFGGFGGFGGFGAKSAFESKPFATKSATTVTKPASVVGATINKSTNGLEYSEGDRVRHIKFGEGTVLNITDGGRDYEVLVNFDNAGQKKMFASFAKLKKV